MVETSADEIYPAVAILFRSSIDAHVAFFTTLNLVLDHPALTE